MIEKWKNPLLIYPLWRSHPTKSISLLFVTGKKKDGEALRFSVLMPASSFVYFCFFLFSIISCMIGARMISIAWLILPPGVTNVLARDMNELGIICR
jgi:hypothetical protein